MNNKVQGNVRELVRKGQMGAAGPLASSITVEARVDGRVVARFDMPAETPLPVFKYLQQAVGAMRNATETKRTLLLGVVPNWKAWILRNVLRIK